MLSEKSKLALRFTFLAAVLLLAGFLSALTAMRMAIRGQMVTVPNIGGLSQTDAERVLANQKLLLKIESRLYNDAVESGKIISQQPAAGLALKAGRKVSAFLSLGKRQVAIPDLRGSSLRAAQINVIRRGLHLGVVAQLGKMEAGGERVIVQNPPPNAKEVLTPTVNVLVAPAVKSEAFIVPDFIGQELTWVKGMVEAENFKVGAVTLSAYPGVPRGVILKQTPVAGSKIFSGEEISFEVAR